MSCLLITPPLNQTSTGDRLSRGGASALLRDTLRAEALAPGPLAALSNALYTRLRKVLGQPKLRETLSIVQELAWEGTTEGGQLLGAFLDVNTPGARLLPQIKKLHSMRRVRLQKAANQSKSDRDWLHKFSLLEAGCARLLVKRQIVASEDEKPGGEAPWPTLRAGLHTLLLDIAEDRELDRELKGILVGLLNLEIDSLQSRVSNVAGIVNPFNIPQVTRLLPILSEIDGMIRDLRQLVVWIMEGRDNAIFNKRLSRGLEVLDQQEFSRLLRSDSSDNSIEPLLGLLRFQNDSPIPLTELGAGMARLMALARCLVAAGIREQDLDPITAATIIHKFQAGSEVWIPLEMGLVADIEIILEAANKSVTHPWLPLAGVRIAGGQLCLPLSGGDELSGVIGGALPSFDDVQNLLDVDFESAKPELEGDQKDIQDSLDGAEDADKKKDNSNTAVVQLVMNNIQSVSVLLGFLRNPKVTAIPGLVGKIAHRTRNARIIETIASDKSLYSGFANRDVPLACLNSPCNVPVRSLVKFIHVKYISKVDLRRMAKDKTGMRREVTTEIQKYLDNLD